MAKTSILFMGSGTFATSILQSILDAEGAFELVGVITQPDKPVGRKKVMTPTPVGSFCLENKVNVWQAANSSAIIELVNNENLEFDYLVVADYGVILKEKVLNLAKKHSLNVHGSLLPKYRGASPIQATLLNLDEIAGVSIITMTKGLDSGPVWSEAICQVDEIDDAESLYSKLAALGGQLLVDTIMQIEDAKISPIEQDLSKVSFAGKIAKNDGEINFSTDTIRKIIGKYKAYKVWPGIYFFHNNLKLQIIDLVYSFDAKNSDSRLFFDGTSLVFQNVDGEIKISKIKPESKSEMLVADFVRGNPTFFD